MKGLFHLICLGLSLGLWGQVASLRAEDLSEEIKRRIANPIAPPFNESEEDRLQRAKRRLAEEKRRSEEIRIELEKIERQRSIEERKRERRVEEARKSPPRPPPETTELSIDLRKGGGSLDPEEKLKVLVYTINSISTNTQTLLTTEKLKAQFPSGKIPESGSAEVKFELRRFLKETQIRDLKKFLREQPFVCDRSNDLPQGISVHSLVDAVFGDPSNYYKLLELDNNRAAFERKMAIDREFDGDPRKRSTDPRDVIRVNIAPGDSGVVHGNTVRKLVLQEGIDGLVIRSEDSETKNGKLADHNFILNPVSGKGDAHEEIYELPNGMRAFALRNREGQLQTFAPPTIVKARIINSTSCMKCHATGYIATTGEGGSLEKKALRKSRVTNEFALGQAQISGNFDRYQLVINQANKRFENALNKSGVGKVKVFNKFFDGISDGDISLEKLAEDFETSVTEIVLALRRDLRFKNVLDPESLKDATGSTTIKLSQLASPIEAGRGRTVSLFCALQDRLLQTVSRKGDGRVNSSNDGVDHGDIHRE